MLQNLHVKNLALIDETEVEFGPGLNILTGETGAGKSILLGSVQLALGARYSADLLRSGAKSGLVELTFSVEDESVRQRLEEMDIEPEDGTVTLSRRLTEGRSVCRINGETVNMGILKEAAGLLIDIHGQHDSQSLLLRRNHLSLLDLYGKDEIYPLKDEMAVSSDSTVNLSKNWSHRLWILKAGPENWILPGMKPQRLKRPHWNRTRTRHWRNYTTGCSRAEMSRKR